jgi:hypothetical protein
LYISRPITLNTIIMKKAFNIISSIACIALAVSASSCKFNCVHGSGHQSSETRAITDKFTKLEISGGFKVVLKQDSSQKITITADDNLLKYIKTSVEGGSLHVYSHKNFCNSGEMTLNIGVGNLDEIRSSGATELSCDGKLVAKNIEFHLSGASKVDLELNAANVTTDGSGVTEMTLRGQATSNRIDISGVAKIHAFDFVVSDYDISTSGAGHCEINVLHSLHVSSSGASDIKYRGNPTDVTNDKSGASSLEKVN